MGSHTRLGVAGSLLPRSGLGHCDVHSGYEPLSGSQIRRFTVENPSSTSFFKLFGPHIGLTRGVQPHAFSLAAFHLHTPNSY